MGRKIPEDFKRRLVACVRKALQDDLQNFLSEYQPETKNAVPHLIADWINTNIQRDLASSNIDMIKFKRYSWTGNIIIDKANRVIYTIMREKRISQIKKEKRDRPHYLQTIVAVLNKKLRAPIKQKPLIESVAYQFDRDTLEKDYNSIFAGRLNINDGFIYCVIVYDAYKGDLADIKALFLDRDLDIVEQISMNEYIKPDFAALTDAIPYAEKTKEAETQTSDNLVSIKTQTAETANSQARLREQNKQA